MKISRFIIFALLAGYLVWVVYPMAWVAYSSLKTDEAIFREAFALPPLDALQTDNYTRAWNEARFGDYFINSVLVTLTSVALIVMLGAMAAYALARFYHPLGKGVFWLFLAGLMVPVQLSIVPLFFELRALGLLNSRTGLILVYTANGLPFAIFILAGFFKSLPRSLYEAAVVDGCSEASAFWRVMLPLAKPGLVTVAIFQFIGIWKEYFFAFMFTSGDAGASVRTLPLGLANLSITSQYRSDYGMLFAGLVIVTVPILIVFIALQKHLVKGVTAGALKG
ncbi:carbohydrate ABC transporter permease [Rariglobus hedericola]|uniref:sn-glycerol-3-phosphate transport system permease protein UgpE n=1 Tax=Rariglobus hedericola TaxID=2597822 RepID=A0A556QIY8_9BACT|nr:carbohydrate ABC transporter permease [Rariglobus hedericola]TSJ76614.1 carbohydrate ABC transporter permease [Rariglobus hedericola]